MSHERLDEFNRLAEADRWSEALPISEQIVGEFPDAPLPWFNHGVCLDEVERHMEAAQAFQRALQFEISEEEGITYVGTQFRMLRSLMLAEEMDICYREVRTMLDVDPYSICGLAETETFEPHFENPPFRELLQAAKQRINPTPEYIAADASGGLLAEHVNQLAEHGIETPETVGHRWNQPPCLRPIDDIVHRLQALFCVFAFVCDERSSAEDISERIDAKGLEKSLGGEESYMLSIDRSVAMEQFGHTGGWYVERLLPLAWILGSATTPDHLGQLLSGDGFDELTRFCEKFPSAGYEVRNIESIKNAEGLLYAAHCGMRSGQVSNDFDEANAGVVLEHWQSLYWALSPNLSPDSGLWPWL